MEWLRRARLRRRATIHGRPTIEAGVKIEGEAEVILEDGCRLGAGCRIEAHGGTVRIGAGARVGERAVLVAHAGIEIGARAVIGDWAALTDAEPTFDDAETPTRLQPLRAAPIRVGDDARVGPHAAILAGGEVPAGAEVAPYGIVDARYAVLTERPRSA
jgi:acetyltransferase-like isoleucine patch superfamily enzyme